MIWLSLLLLVAGIGLAVIAALRRSRALNLALAGTAVAGFAVIGAASIGIYFVPLALVLLGSAAWKLARPRSQWPRARSGTVAPGPDSEDDGTRT